MIILRSLAALAGIVILLFGPGFSLEGASIVNGAPLKAGWTLVALAMSVIVLLSSGFLLVAVAGRRIIRTPWLRVLAGVLLTLPMLASILALLRSPQSDIMTVAFSLLGSAGFLFIAFVWPAAGRAARRPMRANDDNVDHPAA